MKEFARLGELGYTADKRRQAFFFLENNSDTYLIRTVRRIVCIWTGYWSFDQEYLREEPFEPENMVFLTSLTLLSLIGLYKTFGLAPTSRRHFSSSFSSRSRPRCRVGGFFLGARETPQIEEAER